jgi:hypothetical protein
VAKKDVSAIVSGAGVLAAFATELQREVRSLRGSDDDLYSGFVNSELIRDYANLIVTRSGRPVRVQVGFGWLTEATFEVKPSKTVQECISEAVLIASQNGLGLAGATIHFTFNGTPIVVNACSQPDVVYRDWRARSLGDN